MKQPPSDIETVHTCWGDQEAAIIVSLLNSNGIAAVRNSEVPHDVYPLTVDGLGAVEIRVPAEDADRAREIIAQEVEGEGETAPSSEDE